jgi:uncharacterized protein (DUF2062 family)
VSRPAARGWAAAWAWLQRHVPSRDQLERNRWVQPFAHLVLRPELWRLTRRSVPRGVALGLFVGVMIPLAHFVVAAFIAIFIRANIPAAMLATFIGFPVIYVGLLAAAVKIGGLLLRVDAITVSEPITQAVSTVGGSLGDSTARHHWLHRAAHLVHLVEGKGPSVLLGLFVIATVLALIGYCGASVFWRWWIGRKWRLRSAGTAQRVVA